MEIVLGAAPLMHRRAFEWLVGFTVFKVTDSVFDYVLYPFVIYKLGLVAGGMVMTVLSLMSCAACIFAYDRLKRDWLGIETAKALRNYDGCSRWRLRLAGILKRSDVLAFFALSLRFDPFITTAYLRRTAYGGLTKRDWRIFLGSVVVSNAAWTLACFGGIEGIRRLIAPN